MEILATQGLESRVVNVVLNGIIKRPAKPLLNAEPTPMTREDVITMLRAALSHRIIYGEW